MFFCWFLFIYRPGTQWHKIYGEQNIQEVILAMKFPCPFENLEMKKLFSLVVGWRPLIRRSFKVFNGVFEKYKILFWMIARSSSLQERPPQALIKPDLNLSTHLAPIIKTFFRTSFQYGKSLTSLLATALSQCSDLRLCLLSFLNFLLAHHASLQSICLSVG